MQHCENNSPERAVPISTALRWLPCALLLLAPLAAAAQDPAQEATAVARRFVAAVERESWDSAAAMVDDEAARAAQLQTLSELAWFAAHQDSIRSRLNGADGGLQGSFRLTPLDEGPDTAGLREHADFVVSSFPGAPTIGELVTLSPRTFVARLFEAAEHPVMPPALAKLAGADTAAERSAGRSRMHVIGALIEVIGSDTVAHVLYRFYDVAGDTLDLSDDEPSLGSAALRQDVLVMPVVRRRGTWWVDPPEFLTIGGASSMILYMMPIPPAGGG